MDLSFPYSTIRESHASHVFALPPATAAIELSEARQFPNRSSGRKSFHAGDYVENLEVHLKRILSAAARARMGPRNCFDYALIDVGASHDVANRSNFLLFVLANRTTVLACLGTFTPRFPSAVSSVSSAALPAGWPWRWSVLSGYSSVLLAVVNEPSLDL
jgi:hypothetical protein